MESHQDVVLFSPSFLLSCLVSEMSNQTATTNSREASDPAQALLLGGGGAYNEIYSHKHQGFLILSAVLFFLTSFLKRQPDDIRSTTVVEQDLGDNGNPS